ncbi:MAG TPA: type II and III secretion system protein family protein [Vitreimonas sp.]|uniref:type II and III secretion system protein family protein n=1 Tax=Vitreimonas sp. TaxID=3069702 RepID=UPI002D3BBD7C|nr:type II and III secretion system protein family protein [Vitreimonas sp.]HYD86603.1 type II and III secretion system protein family protein [Vitreimonas sp.]
MNRGRSLRVSLATALTAAVALTPGQVVAQVEPASATSMRITGGGGAQSASLVLPFGKSAIIDLPADARDILISNPQIADATVRTARRAYVIGRQLGQTNIFFFDASGRQIANVEIRVEPDVEPLNDILSRYTPDANITAEAVNGSIVLSGTARSAGEADRAHQIATQYVATTGGGASGGAESPDRIVNLIQVQGSEQVLVRVRVVEMSRTLVRQLGINTNYEELINQLVGEDDFIDIATRNGFSINGSLLGGLSAAGGVAENILRPNSYTYPSGTVDPNITTGDAGVGGYEFDPDTGQITYGPASVQSARRTDASIEAFERAGLLRVLAEPNLTAISGEAARFLAGGEFPVPVNSEDGQISVEFKPFGVGLAFTPVVMSGGRISLKVATEVSELTTEGAISTGDTPIRNEDGTTTVIRGITIPALQVRRAETTLEMSSGSSIVLAGLIQERTRHALEGVPGVMNTPVLGSLFRSRDFVNNETELVIIVTPYLVRPTSPDQLRTPADGFMNPSEGESLLTGRLNSIYRPARGSDGARENARLQGPHGHVIE